MVVERRVSGVRSCMSLSHGVVLQLERVNCFIVEVLGCNGDW